MKPECQESSLYSGKSSSGHLGIQLAKKVHDLSWKDRCCCPWFTLFFEAQTYTIVHHTHYCSLHGGYLIDRVAMVKVLYAYTDWQKVKRCQESYHMCFNCIGPVQVWRGWTLPRSWELSLMNHASRPCRWRNQPFQRKRPSTNEAVWTEEKMHSICRLNFIVSFNQHLTRLAGPKKN